MALVSVEVDPAGFDDDELVYELERRGFAVQKDGVPASAYFEAKASEQPTEIHAS